MNPCSVDSTFQRRSAAVYRNGQTRSTVFERIQLLSSALRNFMSSRTTLKAFS